MTTGIVYYSKTGNTRAGAEYLARQGLGILIPLVENQQRKGLTGFLMSGFQSLTRQSSELQGDPWQEAQPCHQLILMTPIWAGHGTPAMNAFLQKADLSGKEITIITFQSDPKAGGSEQVHSHYRNLIQERGGRFIRGISLHSTTPGKFAGQEHIEAQLADFLEETK